jgi:hypothetical protein
MPSAAYPVARSNIEWFSAWKPASVMNWNAYPIAPSSRWNRSMSPSSRCRRQLNDGEQLYASSLSGNRAWIASANSLA